MRTFLLNVRATMVDRCIQRKITISFSPDESLWLSYGLWHKSKTMWARAINEVNIPETVIPKSFHNKNAENKTVIELLDGSKN